MARRSKSATFISGALFGLALAAAAFIAKPRLLPQLDAPDAPPQSALGGNTTVYFSPRGGATDAIVRELGTAKRQIRVLAYSFTSAPIAKAIADAHARGVDVLVILDDSQRSGRYTSATFLVNNKVPVLIDAKHAIAHNKVIVIDAETVITGSFNFSKAAEESNAENLLILHDTDLAQKYLSNFEFHRAHAEAYERK